MTHVFAPAARSLRWIALLAALACLGALPAQAQFTERAAVARYNLRGAMDTTFGTGGATITDIPGSPYEHWASGAFTRVMATNDRIITGGARAVTNAAGTVTGTNLILGRYRSSTGAIDTAFGTGGIVTRNIPGFSYEYIHRLVVDSTGRIVILGMVRDPVNPDRERMLVARFTAAGALDVNFNTTGYLIFNAGPRSGDFGMGLTVDATNRVLISGRTSLNNRWQPFIACFRSNDGRLDTTFGTGGLVLTTPPGTTSGEWFDLAIDLNGRIVAAGEAGGNGIHYVPVARFNQTTGALDPTFGTAGIAQVTVPGYPVAYAFDIAVDGANSYTVSGEAVDTANNGKAFMVVRLLSTGAYDNFWSNDGRLVTSFGANTQAHAWRAVFPLNWMAPALVVVGWIQRSDGWRLASVGYNSDGSLYTNWGTGGISQIQVGGFKYSQFMEAITNGSDGKVITFGLVDND